MIIDCRDEYNVVLDGAIASVRVQPTELMNEYRSKAASLRKEASVFESLAHTIGYELADKQVRADKNLSKVCL